MPTSRYINVKISEAAKIAIETIKAHHRPDHEMQELYSLAIMEYLHAYYPHLEQQVTEIIESRREARRAAEANRQSADRQ